MRNKLIIILIILLIIALLFGCSMNSIPLAQTLPSDNLPDLGVTVNMMNTQFVIVLFFFVFFIYFLIPCYYCTESFTYTIIAPAPTCPKGGKFDKEKKICTDKIKGMYGCSGRYHL